MGTTAGENGMREMLGRCGVTSSLASRYFTFAQLWQGESRGMEGL